MKYLFFSGINPRRYFAMAGILCLALIFSGCASTRKKPDLYTLYTRATTYPQPKRNPVIVIPGVLGSKLVDRDTGKIVWGAFDGGYLDPSTAEGSRLAAIPMEMGRPLKDLKDGVEPRGAVDRLSIKVLLLPIRLNAYYNILKVLGVGGYRDEDLGKSGTVKYPQGHFTSFQFDYDWRRDAVENAAELDKFIRQKRQYVQEEIEKRYGIKDYDVKFDIVAHSMGSLLARYYTKYGVQDLPSDGTMPEADWYGARYIERVVMIGPPNAGSIKALTNLTEGFNKGAFLPKYSPAVLGTMPALYELLPKTEHRMVVREEDPSGSAIDVFDPETWKRYGWGLAAENQDKELRKLLPDIQNKEERKKIALDHLEKSLERARQFREALDVPADQPADLKYILFAGDAIPTPSVAAVEPKKGTIKIIRKASGDGSVLRSSALLDDRTDKNWVPRVVTPIRWSNVMFLFSSHIGLTQDPAFSDNLLYQLLEQPEYIGELTDTGKNESY